LQKLVPKEEEELSLLPRDASLHADGTRNPMRDGGFRSVDLD